MEQRERFQAQLDNKRKSAGVKPAAADQNGSPAVGQEVDDEPFEVGYITFIWRRRNSRKSGRGGGKLAVYEKRTGKA